MISDSDSTLPTADSPVLPSKVVNGPKPLEWKAESVAVLEQTLNLMYKQLLESKDFSPSQCMVKISKILYEKKMYVNARDWMKMAADDSKDPVFQYEFYKLQNITGGDTLESIEYLSESAKKGYLLACYYHGLCYENGVQDSEGKKLIDINVVKALEIYKTVGRNTTNETPIYKLQHPKSQYRISMILKNGYGGAEVDEEESLKWAYRSAVQGFGDAAFSIGLRMVNSLMTTNGSISTSPTESEMDVLLDGFNFMQYGADRGLEKYNAEIFEKTILPQFQRLYGSYLMADKALVKTTANLPRFLLPEVENVGLELYRACNLLRFGSLTSVDTYAPTFAVAAAYECSDGAYEYARHLEYHRGKWCKLTEKVAMKKAIPFYWDAAKRGHVLGLMGLGDAFVIDEPYQTAAYMILTKGITEPTVVDLICKLEPPNMGDVEKFLELEKHDYRKQFEAHTEKATVTEIQSSKCCVIQ
ncbi:hypothetical protein BC833DRAFT_575849 [Globomyces pollinis-pini]|nr:hypothetical protein BC833DRAFT_575849 [Globomyces pollinis-pini]